MGASRGCRQGAPFRVVSPVCCPPLCTCATSSVEGSMTDRVMVRPAAKWLMVYVLSAQTYARGRAPTVLANCESTGPCRADRRTLIAWTLRDCRAYCQQIREG